MAARTSKKTISPRKSKASEMTITEFNHIVDEVEKRFDPKFELLNNKIDSNAILLNKKIDTRENVENFYRRILTDFNPKSKIIELEKLYESI